MLAPTRRRHCFPPLQDLWLNEGFATWVGWLAVNAQFPEWKVWDQFLVNEQARGLDLDGLRSSHPIEVEIPDSSKVNEIFDAISYAKARPPTRAGGLGNGGAL